MKNLDRQKELEKYLRMIDFVVSNESLNFPLKNSKIQRVLGNIYEIAHIALGTCHNGHTEWVEKWNKFYQENKDELT